MFTKHCFWQCKQFSNIKFYIYLFIFTLTKTKFYIRFFYNYSYKWHQVWFSRNKNFLLGEKGLVSIVKKKIIKNKLYLILLNHFIRPRFYEFDKQKSIINNFYKLGYFYFHVSFPILFQEILWKFCFIFCETVQN